MKFKKFKFKRIKSTNNTAIRIIRETNCNLGMVTGFFAKLIPFLAKFWWIILAPLAAFGFTQKEKIKSKVKRNSRRKK